MKTHDIQLKDPERPPWKWWALLALVLIAFASYLISSKAWDTPKGPAEVPKAEVVSPRHVSPLVAVGEMVPSSPSAVVKVEPAATLKSELFPDAITNYFEENPPNEAEHPLDPALEVARRGLERLRSVSDYQTRIVKRERIDDELGKSETMDAKIRRPQFVDGQVTTPFSVYLKFVAPKSVEGREVLWVQGRDSNKMLVREAGFLGVVSIYLDPEGRLAMSGSRYPIWEIGFDVLIQRMIEKGERDRKQGMCSVKIDRWVELDGRPCTRIVIEHPEYNPAFDFHRAEIVIDDELNIPVHYSAYLWPEVEGGRPRLIEQYSYLNVRIDPGLTDQDFDRNNPEYNF